MESDHENSWKVAVNYNRFFNPNVCHVCKFFSTNLVVCPWCCLISYCSYEHTNWHQGQHKNFCKVLLKLNEQVRNTRSVTLEQWIELKKTNVRLVRKKLARELKPDEEQILLLAKSCFICYRQNNLTLACKICLSVNICNDHILNPFTHNCPDLAFCMVLNKLEAVADRSNERISDEFLNITMKSVNSMSSYFQNCLGYLSNISGWSSNAILYSNYFSKPLTLLYAMADTDLLYELPSNNPFIIHIIAGTLVDRFSLLAWEIILHQLLSDLSLSGVIICPKLQEKSVNVELCEVCTLNNKKFLYTRVPVTYSNYVLCKAYAQPNIIVGFDVDFADNKIWTAIELALVCQKKPLVLT